MAGCTSHISIQSWITDDDSCHMHNHKNSHARSGYDAGHSRHSSPLRDMASGSPPSPWVMTLDRSCTLAKAEEHDVMSIAHRDHFHEYLLSDGRPLISDDPQIFRTPG
jgi:hypothetical protein